MAAPFPRPFASLLYYLGPSLAWCFNAASIQFRRLAWR